MHIFWHSNSISRNLSQGKYNKCAKTYVKNIHCKTDYISRKMVIILKLIEILIKLYTYVGLLCTMF